ncbi:MAG TPA: hypothetical protein VHF06_09265 [Pseudonocardiaceae bacterium]|jgi:NAD(P)-dependent dehydrogenase (short-subunit alcohol dehydrogenase family)|nr:hypothetical protein [Pseudonocardiaceae bacterium]
MYRVPDQAGKLAVVTGANSGTGKEAAKRLAGGYYGPGGRFGLVGPTTVARPPRRALDTATATRLWAEAERLTGVSLSTVMAGH